MGSQYKKLQIQHNTSNTRIHERQTTQSKRKKREERKGRTTGTGRKQSRGKKQTVRLVDQVEDADRSGTGRSGGLLLRYGVYTS